MHETFRMSKRFYLREKTFLGVGVTADNLFRRTSRNFLGLDIADPGSFGKLFQRGGGRTIQVDARIEF
jgi:hypothetical protein